MYKTFTRALLGAAVALSATASQAQISILKDYTNKTSATIGTYQGITFREAGFSALFTIPNTNGTEFWLCSDRGVNVDDANANSASCRPTYDKMFVFPGYAPKIHRIRLTGDSVQILKTITVKRPNGTDARGVLLPTGLGSTAAEVASTDTVLNCANFNTKTTTKDTFAIDCESIAVDKDGNFWLSEENGPTVWKLDSNGVLKTRYTPYVSVGGAQSVDVAIDTCFKYRRNNRGFEDMALTPSGKLLVAIQSPLYYPTTAIGSATRVHRLLEINPATGAQRMLVYLNDGVIGASGANQIRMQDWKLSDMTAINDSTFLIIEAAARGTSDIKRIYQININGATTITSANYGTTSVEGLVDSAGLAAQNIVPVKKTLFMDMLANGWPAALDKAEGIAVVNDSTLAICNDNDYGQTSPNADGIPTATTNLSHVIVYRLQGANKIKNFVPLPALGVKPVQTQTLEAKLYPNPTTGDAFVELNLAKEGQMTITILNAEGKVVVPSIKQHTGTGTQRIALPTASLPNGIYLVQLLNGTQTAYKKLVVLH